MWRKGWGLWGGEENGTDGGGRGLSISVIVFIVFECIEFCRGLLHIVGGEV